MSDLTQELQRVALLLQRIGRRVCRPEDFDLVSLYLYALALTLGGNELADDAETCPRGDLRQEVSIEACEVNDDLNIVYRRAVIQCDEANGFVATAGAHPAFDVHLLPNERALQ